MAHAVKTAAAAPSEPVTIRKLCLMTGRHRTTIEKWIRSYGLEIVGVRPDGHHLQHALSAEDAKLYLELRKKDGF